MALNEVTILSNPALRLHPNLARLIGVTWEEEHPELALGLSPALVLDLPMWVPWRILFSESPLCPLL